MLSFSRKLTIFVWAFTLARQKYEIKLNII